MAPAEPAAVRTLLAAVGPWARKRPDVRAVALVGSRARGSARADSDVDLVVLTDDPGAYTECEGWIAELGGESVLRTRTWGVLTERRLVLGGGLVADVGIADPSWAATSPVDPGTARVARDGLAVLHDPDGVLAALVVATRGAGLPRPTRP